MSYPQARLGLVANCVLAMALIASGGWARAAVAAADISTAEGKDTPVGGMTTMFAYSDQTFPVPGAANPQPNFYTVYRTPGVPPTTPVPNAVGPGGGIVSITVGGGPALGPSVSVGPKPKPAVPGSENSLYSDSKGLGPGNQYVFAFARDVLTFPVNAPTAVLSALASIVPANSKTTKGSAAAIAFDPGPANSSSTLTSTPYAEAVNVQLALTSPGYAADEFYALDSRLSGGSAGVDSFVDRGQPISEALWSLTMSISSPVTSLAELNTVKIAFMVNPLAVKNGYFFPPVSEATIDSDIRNSLTLKNGIVSLSNFQLFPSGTFYNSDLSITYALADQSELIPVPEPRSWMMLLLGFGVIGVVKRRRSRSSPWRRTRPRSESVTLATKSLIPS